MSSLQDGSSNKASAASASGAGGAPAFVTFNDDYSRLATGSEQGLQLFQLPPTTPFVRRLRKEESLGGVSIVAVVGSSGLVAIVSQSTNRFLQLFDLADNTVLTEVHFDAAVLAVRINSKRMAVILERHTHLFDLNTMAALPQIRTSNPLNRQGLGTLTGLTEGGHCYFAFPQSSDNNEAKGDVFVIDAMGQEQISVIAAHANAVAALEFSQSGNVLATVSVKGSVIRVFSNPSPVLLYTLRRGSTEAVIFSMAFNFAGTILAAASNSGTLHLFRCDARGPQTGEQRAFAKVPMKRKTRTLCGVSSSGSVLTLVTCPLAGVPGMINQFEITGDTVQPLGEFPLV